MDRNKDKHDDIHQNDRELNNHHFSHANEQNHKDCKDMEKELEYNEGEDKKNNSTAPDTYEKKNAESEKQKEDLD